METKRKYVIFGYLITLLIPMIQQYYLVGIANPVIWILSFAGECRVFCLGFRFEGFRVICVDQCWTAI